MTFEFDNTYCFQIKPEDLKIPFLSFEESLNFLRNDRVGGFLVEQMLKNMFGFKLTQNNSMYDAEFNGKKIEIRTINKTGSNLISSNMIGASRKYDEKKYLQKLGSIDYFCFVDMRNLPNIFIFCYPSKRFYQNGVMKTLPKELMTKKLTAKIEMVNA